MKNKEMYKVHPQIVYRMCKFHKKNNQNPLTHNTFQNKHNHIKNTQRFNNMMRDHQKI
jgi:hypothetical protein